ncbi:MAG: helicase-associated domain-containing protein [Gemmatimonadaceae bacterium]
MKLFDVKWASVLRGLSRWTALRLSTRRVVLEELKTNSYVSAQRFGLQLDAIVQSGIAQVDQGWTRLWLDDEQRDLVKVLRAMGRHQVFDAPTQESLVKYMEEHFTNDEITALGSKGHRGYGVANRHTLAPRVGFSGWVEDLLDAKNDDELLAWVAARGVPLHGFSTFSLWNLQRLARLLADSPHGESLSDLVAKRPDDDVDAFANSLSLGLRTLILFAGMRGRDLEPMIGLWPTVASELTRPRAQPPAVVVPKEHFALAVQMEDMTTLLAAVVAAPVRLRTGDLAVFARLRAEIEGRLVPLPAWVAHLFANPQSTRVDRAARELESRHFVQVREHHGNPHLESTRAGAAWLTLSPYERLAALLGPLRNSEEMNPRSDYDVVPAPGFFSFSLPYLHAPKSLRLRRALTAAFLGTTGYIPFEKFFDYHAREANPFLNASTPPEMDLYRLMYYGGTGDPREEYRRIWRSMLSQFLGDRLIGFAGASVGHLESGALCFALTDVGRYLLGDAESFVYGAREAGDVVVQPNFDVVFLGAAPSTEAALARFAERVGVAPGLTFRLTRKSVLRAAEAGATSQEVLGALSGASSKPVPKNVEREITGWMAAVRRGRLRVAQLIECADEESATRIAAVLGAKARRITPTIFEIEAATPSARAAMTKKLRAAGVFLEDQTGRSAAKSPRPRPRFVNPEDLEDDWVEEE